MLYVGFTDTATALVWNPLLCFRFEVVNRPYIFLVQLGLNPIT